MLSLCKLMEEAPQMRSARKPCLHVFVRDLNFRISISAKFSDIPEADLRKREATRKLCS